MVLQAPPWPEGGIAILKVLDNGVQFSPKQTFTLERQVCQSLYTQTLEQKELPKNHRQNGELG